MHGDGSFGKTLRNILPYITPDQKKRLELASERRKLALPAPTSKLALESKPLKGVFRTLRQKPNLLLEISIKFSNRTYSINDGYLSKAHLEEMVDEETGELTRLGEAVISGASEGIQAAIRANFRLRYQQPDLPPYSPPQAFHRPEETWHPDAPADSSYSSLLPPTPSGGWQLPPTPSGGWPQNAPGEWHPDTPAGSSYRAWPAQPEASSSTVDDLESLDSRQNYGYREFDLNTPQEEEEPWDYGTQTPVGHSAMSPERIDVDNLPSPQDVADPELPPVTATSWLLDGHLRAYTEDLARQLRGQPNVHLLHFADSQVVTMLSSADPDQQARARRLLVGDNVPPIVFLPINQPNAHWSLLVVDRRNSDSVATYHYDSMKQKDPQQRYLADMAAYHLGLDYEETHEMPTAIQPDYYSCGDHVLTGIEMLAHRVIDGTFDYAGGRDLSDIEPDRGLIRDRLAQAAQAPAESSGRSVPERPSNTRKRKASGGSSSNSTIGDRGSAAIR
ncbi:Ulp1 family isopeptidase [Xanthomonas hortorum]|uniref:Ulp1 family isopeptidase n=1 Tax=Xanthomonas hortorum TaxID=56454 RepID=UPI001F337806|nr:Ulp1 family isopeptidase [Xanthomonas hortorum]MCE4360558.1 C48 family peptidase [Xanthomonas hortorum pv. taraxaci]